MELTYGYEADAIESQKNWIALGAEVSLIAYDEDRKLYVFDVYQPAPGDTLDAIADYSMVW